MKFNLIHSLAWIYILMFLESALKNTNMCFLQTKINSHSHSYSELGHDALCQALTQMTLRNKIKVPEKWSQDKCHFYGVITQPYSGAALLPTCTVFLSLLQDLVKWNAEEEDRARSTAVVVYNQLAQKKTIWKKIYSKAQTHKHKIIDKCRTFCLLSIQC